MKTTPRVACHMPHDPCSPAPRLLPRAPAMFIGTAGWWLSATTAFASQDAPATVRVISMATAAGVAFVVGMLLYLFSQRSSRVQFHEERPPDAVSPRAEGLDSKALMPAILQQLEQLPASNLQREQVARTVSDIVAKTFEERTTTVKQELTER